MKTLSNLTAVEILLIAFTALIVWSILKGLWMWLFRKKKQKVKKEFQIKVFVKDDIVVFPRAEVEKWSCYHGKLIKITKKNGDKVWFNGYPFIVDTFIKDLS